MVSPIMPHIQSATEVVKPLIWFLELYKIELLLIMAMAITAAAEISGMLVPAKLLSSIIATVDASETRINVRWPAAWRLLARSQPIIAAKTTDTATRSSTEYRFNSVDQPPSRLAMGSFIFMDGCLLSICRP